MTKRMLIDALHPEESRVVIADDSRILEYDFITAAKKQIKGNLYLGKITRVEPSLQAAFVEYGGNRQGFLPFAEIHPDYYQIPVSDRKRLMEEAMREEEEDEEDDEPERGRKNNSLESRQPITMNYELDDFVAPAEAGAIPTAASFTDIPPPAENVSLAWQEERPSLPDAPETVSRSGVEGQYSTSDQSADVVRSEPIQDIPQENLSSTQEEPFAENIAPNEIPATDVEIIASEEEERRPKRRFFSRRYKIQEVIKRGQIVLVQVIKEERGNKGVSLSTYISLPGRYCVLMPNSPKAGGVSRKISNNDDRKRLRQIFDELKMAGGMSAIIRTAGIDRTRPEIKRDFDYLVKLWDSIRQQTLSSTAPALIYEESNLIKRAIRDLYNGDIEEVLVEGDEGYRTAKDFMKLLMPSHAPRVKHYKNDVPLFYEYQVEDQLLTMYDPVVRLRSGGYIVLSPTEALIAIDVNSGRSTSERNIEETATKTNLEAAGEIARQLRLRDLAGLIVIDFIDMMDGRNRRNVERALRDALKQDRAKIQVGRISPFGLMEMSRQRLRPSISEASMINCPNCTGRGLVRSNESLSIQIIRSLEKEAAQGSYSELRLITSAALAQYLFNRVRETISEVEKRFELRITIMVDATLAQAGLFRIEKVKTRQPRDPEEGEDAGMERDFRRGRKRYRNEDETVREDSSPASEEISEKTPVDEAEEIPQHKPRGERGGQHRSRGGRGRGRYGRRDGFETAASDVATPGQEIIAGSDNEVVREEDTSREPAEGKEREERGGRRGRRGGRNRGGRGRHKWRDRKPDAQQGGESAHTPESFGGDEMLTSYRHPSPPVEKEIPITPVHEASEWRSERNQARDEAMVMKSEAKPKGPARKGWWKRMTE